MLNYLKKNIFTYTESSFFVLTIIACAVIYGYLIVDTMYLLMILFIAIGFVLVLQKSRRNIAFGVVIILTIMNNGYDLIPASITQNTILKKTWDFGFIYMIVIMAPFIPQLFKKRDTYTPQFVKYFYLFLSIVLLSFLISLLTLPYPFIDTFRSFRDYLGYCLLPLLAIALDKNNGIELSVTFKRLITLQSYVFLVLLILFNIQYVLQHQFFYGYSNVYKNSAQEYIRSIPVFLMTSYFFFWLFLAQWIRGKKLTVWKWLYIILSCSATLFTFTRGLYASIVILVLMLFVLMIWCNRINMARFSVTVFLGLVVVVVLSMTSLATPYYARMISSVSDMQANEKNSTFDYRKRLVEDRINIIKNNNVYLGIGFVHNKYAYHDYGPFIGNHKIDELPAIWCADIAWGNIIYQTGLLGTLSFMLFIGSLIVFIFKELHKYQGDLFFFQLASCFELLRNVILMFNGASYTYQTQNMALFLALSAYLHCIHTRRLRIKI